jgi:hypothetical protein
VTGREAGLASASTKRKPRKRIKNITNHSGRKACRLASTHHRLWSGGRCESSQPDTTGSLVLNRIRGLSFHTAGPGKTGGCRPRPEVCNQNLMHLLRRKLARAPRLRYLIWVFQSWPINQKGSGVHTELPRTNLLYLRAYAQKRQCHSCGAALTRRARCKACSIDADVAERLSS